MRRVVISCGTIPANLDSVKFITNRFRGGLAFKTAEFLSHSFDVTVVKWKFTEYSPPAGIHVVNINNVFDYYDWMKANACNYDAFIMAGAVANLTPSHPYEGKFPSHLYKVGEKFNIEFEIAPRAIDVIKQMNPRCCLIGFKLFDAETDEQLIEIGRHTLNDAKANCVFANTPSDAKNWKIALLQDGANIKMSFDEHLEFMKTIIESQYFRTEVVDCETADDEHLKALTQIFEQSFEQYGTVAFRCNDGKGIITTSRGHKAGVVVVKDVDYEKRIIYASGRATMNAPLLFKILQNGGDYVVHRHQVLEGAPVVPYTMPGTAEEVRLAQVVQESGAVNIEHHGFVQVRHFSDVDWTRYYQQFPEKYFSCPDRITRLLEEYSGRETLEVGGNATCMAKCLLDPFFASDTCENITYHDLEHRRFDLIVMRNSINYLSEQELDAVIHSRCDGGIVIANTFLVPPDFKADGNEVAYRKDGRIWHSLVVGDEIMRHSFYARDQAFYESKGFRVEPYRRNSALLTLS